MWINVSALTPQGRFELRANSQARSWRPDMSMFFTFACIARALAAGAPAIERLDRLIQLLARQTGVPVPTLNEITAPVDAKLLENTAPTPA